MPEPSSPKGIYANYFEVGYTAFEIVIDFGQRYGRAKPPCHTRIVTSPVYAQAMLETLRAALEQYTRAFGPPLEPSGEEHPRRDAD